MKVILAVTNDIATDNRLHKISTTLIKNGYDVYVFGRKLRNSLSVAEREYTVRRISLWFNKGPLFYINYNIALFFYLLRNNFEIIVSNDLDTLLASYLVSKTKQSVLVYDSHEYFTEVPELINRKFIRGIWKLIEKLIVPRLKYAYTVSGLIAEQYKKEYKKDFKIIRNSGYFKYDCDFEEKEQNKERRTIIYQGVLNKGRGLETMIEAMHYIDSADFIIAGVGDIENELHKLVNYFGLAAKVKFLGRLKHKELWKYTQHADLGISLEEDMGLNYRYALPNKLFDYIQARIPVLVSDLPEMKKVVNDYNIGEIAAYREPELLAEQINRMFTDEEKYQQWKINLEIAARELCWQREEEKLVSFYHDLRAQAIGY